MIETIKDKSINKIKIYKLVIEAIIYCLIFADIDFNCKLIFAISFYRPLSFTDTNEALFNVSKKPNAVEKMETDYFLKN